MDSETMFLAAAYDGLGFQAAEAGDEAQAQRWWAKADEVRKQAKAKA